MEQKYTLNDVAEMTGLTTRTLRNDIKLGFLEGQKEDGVWRFTQEEFTAFISHPSVRPTLQAKRQGIVYDFLADTKKKETRVCLILDDECGASIEDMMPRVNRLQAGDESLRFALHMQDGRLRLILSAAVEDGLEFLKAYMEA